MADLPRIHRTTTPVARSILHNHNGEPEQLLLIQWVSAILLCLLISWNAVVDAYLGHDPVYNSDGSVSDYRPSKFRPIGADTLLFLFAMAGGSGVMYNLKRSQDKKADLDRERLRVAPTPPAPKSTNPLDTDPGDPNARI